MAPTSCNLDTLCIHKTLHPIYNCISAYTDLGMVGIMRSRMSKLQNLYVYFSQYSRASIVEKYNQQCFHMPLSPLMPVGGK